MYLLPIRNNLGQEEAIAHWHVNALSAWVHDCRELRAMGRFCSNGSKSITDYECLLTHLVSKKAGSAWNHLFFPQRTCQIRAFSNWRNMAKAKQSLRGKCYGKRHRKILPRAGNWLTPIPEQYKQRVQNIIACCRWTLVVWVWRSKMTAGIKKSGVEIC